MSDIYSALEDARLRREAQNTNATRSATCVLTYDTTGVGESTTTGALDFGMAFVQQPSVATGAVALTLPDTTYYRYPTISAGVWKWATEDSTNLNQPLYTGAWLFFTVQCDPRTIMRTNGDDYDYWDANVKILRDRLNNAFPGTQDYATIQNQVARAQAQLAETILAKELQDNPAKVAIRHHLTFNGVAAQEYSLDPAFTQPLTTVPVTFF